MSQVASFSVNPFQENTYVLYDDTKECAIIDPGCYDTREQNELVNFIKHHELTPRLFLNTHCHLDHIFSNKFVADKFKLGLQIHEKELPILKGASIAASMYGVALTPSPEPDKFLKEGDELTFGNTKLKVLFTPGHSPGSVCFFNKEEEYLIAGDVLFLQSIGRTDLPGGNHQDLIDSIKNKLLPLGDKVIVHPGHGPQTTIGFEKENNPFLT